MARNKSLWAICPGSHLKQVVRFGLVESYPSNAFLLARIPGHDYVVRGRYIELGTQEAGDFGWVGRGADIQTGDLVGTYSYAGRISCEIKSATTY